MTETKLSGLVDGFVGCTDSIKDSIFKDKVVVIMGATGSGKSKLGIDIADHFPVEIINADSMQVYQGLDVLTNKVPIHEQKGVPHHLLGTICGNSEFTAKDFKDSATPLINAIWSRNHLPVIVGGTNYYIQALVSKFLLDDQDEEQGAVILRDVPGVINDADFVLEHLDENDDYSYNRLKELDPSAANRIHPNDRRKIKQYMNLFSRFGVIPNAPLSALDVHVDQRVDLMVSCGLLREVFEIYKSDADYTRGLRQAIGVREFEDVLTNCNTKSRCSSLSSEIFNKEMLQILDSSIENSTKLLLEEAIDKVKLNTRRLVRRQKRRLKRLELLFNWSIHFVDVTSCLSCASEKLWNSNAVKPAVDIIISFLDKPTEAFKDKNESHEIELAKSDLWTRHVCQACGNKQLRGEHEWEQHKQGRKHRKRVSSLRKSGNMLPNRTE